jgi:hypothetical protein
VLGVGGRQVRLLRTACTEDSAAPEIRWDVGFQTAYPRHEDEVIDFSYGVIYMIRVRQQAFGLRRVVVSLS